MVASSEREVRRRAQRLRLVVRKSPYRDEAPADGYMVVDPARKVVVAGSYPYRYSMTMNEVDEFLAQCEEAASGRVSENPTSPVRVSVEAVLPRNLKSALRGWLSDLVERWDQSHESAPACLTASPVSPNESGYNSDPTLICEQCGDRIESVEVRDLARIRFGRRLDRKCYLGAKEGAGRTSN